MYHDMRARDIVSIVSPAVHLVTGAESAGLGLSPS
jgi:hypothetical protein